MIDILKSLTLGTENEDIEPKPDLAICSKCGWRGVVEECEEETEGDFEGGYYKIHLCPKCEDGGCIDDYEMTEEQAGKWWAWNSKTKVSNKKKSKESKMVYDEMESKVCPLQGTCNYYTEDQSVSGRCKETDDCMFVEVATDFDALKKQLAEKSRDIEEIKESNKYLVDELSKSLTYEMSKKVIIDKLMKLIKDVEELEALHRDEKKSGYKREIS